jgi:hypothetical protein
VGAVPRRRSSVPARTQWSREPPRLVIVSYLAHANGTPRGERTRALARALADSWDVELVAGPPGGPGGHTVAGRRMRRAARRVRDTALIDKQEPWSRRRVARWRPDADMALLIGPPFSLVGRAARRLARAGVPFVLDLGDPWTHGVARTPAALRARRQESFALSHAAGAIVTTQEQASRMTCRRAAIPVLVRPNGHAVYPPMPRTPPARTPEVMRRLRLAHFGHLYGVRIDLEPFAAGLRASMLWDEIELHVFGEDWDGVLAGVRRHAAVVEHEPVRWSRVIELSAGYSAALVVGNRGGIQLPSKVVQYQTLPVPRIVVVEDPARDCIASYVRDKPAWLVCSATDPDAARHVRDHCGRDWGPGDLAPPPGESWPEVTATIDAFLHDVAARERLGPT